MTIEGNYLLFTIDTGFPYFLPFPNNILLLLFPALKFSTQIIANYQAVIQKKSILQKAFIHVIPSTKIKTFYNFPNILMYNQIHLKTQKNLVQVWLFVCFVVAAVSFCFVLLRSKRFGGMKLFLYCFLLVLYNSKIFL